MNASRIARALDQYRPGMQAVGVPAIIAEAGVNHEGSIDLARRLIDEAAEGGADAIKFQTYRSTTLAVQDSPAYWDLSQEPTRSQRALFAKYDRFWKKDFEVLKSYCDQVGIEFMSTPFDLEAASFLNDLVGVFKVASADITSLPFLRHIASYGKPIVLSTGASTVSEIATAVEVLGPDIRVCLMHCVLNYPTEQGNANLGMILDLRAQFPELVPGYSDHTVPDPALTVPVIAALLGARVIEKHFTFDKSRPGNDHYHAMDVADLKVLRSRLDNAFAIVGDTSKHPLGSEAAARKYARRSLVTVRDLPSGHTITEDDLTWKRPGTGISPSESGKLIGRRTRQPIAADTIVIWAMVE